VIRKTKQSAMSERDAQTALSEHAARWAVRVDAGELTAAEQDELEAWTNADPRHAGAFARAMAANAYFDRMAALNPQDIQQAATTTETQTVSDRPAVTRRAWLGGGLCAMAATIIAAIDVSRWHAGEHITAPLGSVRRAALADGSAVTLNTNAEITVALEQSVRRVHLLAGEVNFDVANDRNRPFLIDAGPVQVQVVGTSFLVRRTGHDTVAITVREGIVEVHRDGNASVRLLAGDRLIVGSAAPIRRERLSMADVDRMSLWQRGEIDLTGMTLGEAAAEFARYSDRRIIITDPQVARLKVAGIYSTSDPAGFAQAAALAQDLQIRADRAGVLLSR
jgi:transmembrane sensor